MNWIDELRRDRDAVVAEGRSFTFAPGEWSIKQSEIGGIDFLEMRRGAMIFRFIPSGGGSQVDVSINGGRDWRYSSSRACSMFEAEAFGNAVAALWRAENARRGSRKPYRQTTRAAVGQARARSTAARAAREEEGGQGDGLRDWRDPPPAGFTFDRPDAVAFARIELASYRASIEGRSGGKDLFSAAVAVVRGYGLLPDAQGGIVLAEYNADAEPPWSDDEIRRALVLAESSGRMPWGVLLFRDLARMKREGHK